MSFVNTTFLGTASFLNKTLVGKNMTSAASSDSGSEESDDLTPFALECPDDTYITAVYGSVTELGYTRQFEHPNGVFFADEVPFQDKMNTCPMQAEPFNAMSDLQRSTCAGMDGAATYQSWSRLEGPVSAAASSKFRYSKGGGINKVRHAFPPLRGHCAFEARLDPWQKALC